MFFFASSRCAATMLDDTVLLPAPLSCTTIHSPITLGAVAVVWPLAIGCSTQESSADSFFVAGSQKKRRTLSFRPM